MLIAYGDRQSDSTVQVGSGKSSLLSALLGEVQPLQPPEHGAAGAVVSKGPVMRGSVAYCSQVPWVNAGTIRVRLVVLFICVASNARAHSMLMVSAKCSVPSTLDFNPHLAAYHSETKPKSAVKAALGTMQLTCHV